MWQNLRKRLCIVKAIFDDYHRFTPQILSIANINTTAILFKSEPLANSSHSLKLVTAFSGISKDYFFTKNYSGGKKRPGVCGDDSW